MLSELAGEALQNALDGGGVVLLFEHREFDPGGVPYTITLYIGESEDDECDVQVEDCPYVVDKDSFDEDCQPLVALDNAAVEGATLSAGGPGYNFLLPLPLSDEVILEVVLYDAQVQAQITFDAGGPGKLEGLLGGAISKEAMIEAVEAVDEDKLPLDKEMIITMLDLMIMNDIDTDGNGEYDAASIGLPFVAIRGSITGIAQ